jgi:ankyrin repeat protein
LHAAVNQGNLVLVELLLKSLTNDGMAMEDSRLQTSTTQSSLFSSCSVLNARPTFRLDVNKRNEKCMDMTPLHLAVFNDYDEIAIRLVQSDANPNLKIKGEISALSMALENKNQVLYELLGDYYQNKNFDC